MEGPIIVIADAWRGEVSEITYEMLGAGRRLARALGSTLIAAIWGRAADALATQLGAADTVLLLEDPRLEMADPAVAAAAIKAVMERTSARLALVGGTNPMAGVGALAAHFTNAQFVNFCSNIEITDEGLIATSRLFGGKMLSRVRLGRQPVVLSIYPGSFPAQAGRVEGGPRVERIEAGLPEPAVRFQRFIEPDAGDLDITKEEILVSVGRGIQNRDNLAVVEELAEALGGAVSASRPIVDQGWLPMTRQVGKSGMNVSPRLYLALGISGAPEHWEGMKNAQLIVAINTDAQAPIFNFAHVGACADLLEVTPLLTERLRQRKGIVKT